MDTPTKTYRVRMTETQLFYVDVEAVDEGEAIAEASHLIALNQTDDFCEDKESGYSGYVINGVGEYQPSR